MRTPFFLFIFSCYFFYSPVLAFSASPSSEVIVVSVSTNSLIYARYNYDGLYSVDLSDLTLHYDLSGNKEIFNVFYPEPHDYKNLLLSKGYASLKDGAQAPEPYRNAQIQAQNAHLGIWKRINQPPPHPLNWSVVFIYLSKVFFLFATMGFLTFSAKYFYRKFYIQRRIRLLIIGERSAGKSGLFETLVDSDVPKSKILGLEGSRSIDRKNRISIIPKGRFEILANMTDIPGPLPGRVWDAFLGKPSHALLVVLAPCMNNGVAPGGKEVKQLKFPENVDNNYIFIQLGYVRAFVEGVLSSTYTKKPKLVAFFISKFDVFSIDPPGVSSTKAIEAHLRALFKEHIDCAQVAAKAAKIPFEVYVGSSAEKWNTKEILDYITYVLYRS